MDLKDIASVSGKPGLYKVLKPTRTGVILETIDQAKSKLIAGGNNRVSLLKEISVYTTGKDSSFPLEKAFENIYKKYGKKINVNAKSEEKELGDFLLSVVPDYDTERVYYSDIKKIVSWFNILSENMSEVFDKEPEKEVPKKEEKVKAEEKPKEEKKMPLKEEKKDKKEVKMDSKPKEEKKSTSKEKPKSKTAKKK